MLSTGLHTTPAYPTVNRELRDLVRFVVEQREKMVKQGHSRLDAGYVSELLRPLQVWVRNNPTPGREALKELWREHGSKLVLLMPGNARKKLERMEKLMRSL